MNAYAKITGLISHIYNWEIDINVIGRWKVSIYADYSDKDTISIGDICEIDIQNISGYYYKGMAKVIQIIHTSRVDNFDKKRYYLEGISLVKYGLREN